PAVVADAVRSYMLESYVQLGAGYALSQRCTKNVSDAHDFINLFMNGENVGKTILGPSCTQLLYMLAGCYADVLKPGEEIIICETAHEANAGPWARLESRVPGITVRTWKIDPVTLTCPLESLEGMLREKSGKVRLVAFPQVSNLLGEIVDVKAITDLAHRYGARVVVDGVAYAPHRAIDVKAWGCDWYVYSTYKVYGPHMGALFGTHEAIAELTGPNHYFLPKEMVPYKFELGGANHEGCAGLLALREYLNFLAGRDERDPITREAIVEAFEVMTALELPLQAQLIDYLRRKPGVRLIGPNHAHASRISTISFISDRASSREIAMAANRRSIGIRHGNMYAYRLCQALGIDTTEGVVRASMVHYNTADEVRTLIDALETVL
ncbi:MAG TPA: aminotransferase class V-fold PLP-dependent enzyme, partial [Phycisphaerales bacterium]|nr:aminotransferase class V-fold PLP-dependent enzyme [Phycisphaerales bacterium]